MAVTKASDDCIHGGEVWTIARERGLDPSNILDFSSNVNPLGPPTSSIKRIKDNLWKIPYYPDRSYSKFRSQVAEHLELDTIDNIVEGSGSTELIQLFAELLINEGDKVVIPVPTYGEYERLVRIRRGIPVLIRPTRGLGLDIDRVKQELGNDCKALILCNPNNPTSTIIQRTDLISIINLAYDKGIFVLVDESFVEFADKAEISLSPDIEEFANLFIIRSLTKFYALPGLRIGYGIASLKLADRLRKIKMPWSLNSLAEEAGISALQDLKYMKKTRELISKERGYLYSGLKEIHDLTVFKPEANFILLRIQKGMTAETLKESLLDRYSILIRDCASFSGLGNEYFRVCVRLRNENSSLLSALKEIMV